MRFWVSWYQTGEDHRPLNYPPGPAILGWWCSGYTEDEKSIMCAVVEADDHCDASDAICVDWPEAPGGSNWRIFDLLPADWQPNDRFPLADWMTPRFKVKAEIEKHQP